MSPVECPCEFHGTLHPPGSVVTEDCNAWSVSTAWREGPGKARASCQTACLGLGIPEQARVAHLIILRSKGMSLILRSKGMSFDLWDGGDTLSIHFRNGMSWAGAWDSVWALRAGWPPS